MARPSGSASALPNDTNFVYSWIMKNITITMDDETAAWVRVEAAKAGLSVSRFVAANLTGARRVDAAHRDALDRFLCGPGYPGIARDLPSRDDLHDL
jgi:hypothetical protein